MSEPIELLLSRLDDPRPNGRDRWRAACPVCGGRNRSTLSVGIGDSGAVLVRCWKSGCEPSTIAHAVGLELVDLFPERLGPGQGAGSARRRRLITAAQALEVLELESTLAMVCASDMARGQALDDATRERLMVGAARIAQLRQETRA
jgi:hypothetical protein